MTTSFRFLAPILSALLCACGGADTAAPGKPPPVIDPGTGSGTGVEVAASDRKIALIVGADQAFANSVRIDAFALGLASDLNRRAGSRGPRYAVQVLAAAASASGVREQLKGYNGAFLIGNTPVPTQIDAANGQLVPDMEPLRAPYCEAYRFEADGTRVIRNQSGKLFDLKCRTGITISVLRGRAAQTQLADIGSKLEQMTQYHAASDSANLAWERRYDYVGALWGGGQPWEDTREQWAGFPLYTPAQILYTMAGSGAARRSAFAACLARNQEMCGLNAHGAADLVQFEGPGVAGAPYSSDVAAMYATDFAANPTSAKFVSLASCSTHNFLPENSFATSLLMSGKTLLSLGSTAVAVISGTAEAEQVAKHMPHLMVGATVADAFTHAMEGTGLNFQGDPYISMRPVPSGPVPTMLIDGKHYNDGARVIGLDLPDSVGQARATRSVTIRNEGSADLRLKLSVYGVGLGIDGKAPGFASLGGLGFELDAPSVIDKGNAGDLGDVVLTVKPGASLVLKYGLEPVKGNGSTVLYGVYTARMEIVSNDPAAFLTFLELRGTVR
jgi:hypothetical protein